MTMRPLLEKKPTLPEGEKNIYLQSPFLSSASLFLSLSQQFEQNE